MTVRSPHEWIWTAAIAAGSSVVALLAVWFLVIAPQLLEPSAMIRRQSEREQVLAQFQQELNRTTQLQWRNQQEQFDAGMKRIEESALQRVDQAAERVAQRQLSDAFLAELRTQVLDQARQSGDTTAPSPRAAAGGVETMLREDLNGLAAVRLGVSEAWLSNGRAPNSNADAGVGPPESFAGKLLRTLTIGANGTITVEFDPKVIANTRTTRAVLVATPKWGANPGTIDWRCSTNIAPVLKIMPICELHTTPAR